MKKNPFPAGGSQARLSKRQHGYPAIVLVFWTCFLDLLDRLPRAGAANDALGKLQIPFTPWEA
jgi:hypothetical protein